MMSAVPYNGTKWQAQKGRTVPLPAPPCSISPFNSCFHLQLQVLLMYRQPSCRWTVLSYRSPVIIPCSLCALCPKAFSPEPYSTLLYLNTSRLYKHFPRKSGKCTEDGIKKENSLPWAKETLCVKVAHYFALHFLKVCLINAFVLGWIIFK